MATVREGGEGPAVVTELQERQRIRCRNVSPRLEHGSPTRLRHLHLHLCVGVDRPTSLETNACVASKRASHGERSSPRISLIYLWDKPWRAMVSMKADGPTWSLVLGWQWHKQRQCSGIPRARSQSCGKRETVNIPSEVGWRVGGSEGAGVGWQCGAQICLGRSQGIFRCRHR